MPSFPGRKQKYAPCAFEDIPEGIKWKPQGNNLLSGKMTMLSMFGAEFKLVRDLATGAIQYFRSQNETKKSPAESIDAEPAKTGQARYRVGTQAWFIDADKWYLIEVVSRVGQDRPTYGEPKRIVIKSATGWDAEHKAEWPFGEELEFVAQASNGMFARLRPLRARKL